MPSDPTVDFTVDSLSESSEESSRLRGDASSCCDFASAAVSRATSARRASFSDSIERDIAECDARLYDEDRP